MPKLITVAAFAAAIAMVPVMLFSASLRPALGQPQSGGSIPVTVDNFIRAESDLYLGGILKDSGVIGKFNHRREPASDRQSDSHPPQPRHALFQRGVRS